MKYSEGRADDPLPMDTEFALIDTEGHAVLVITPETHYLACPVCGLPCEDVEDVQESVAWHEEHD